MGHVFVTIGDIRKIACDAWLLPCNETFFLARYWRHGDEATARLGRQLEASIPSPPGWGRDGLRSLKAPGASADLPVPFLVNVGLKEEEVGWVVDGVRQFLESVSGVTNDPSRYLSRRERPLVAIPVVGTGYGGSPKRRAEIVRALLELLRSDLPEKLDVVVVTRDWSMFSAAQSQRREVFPTPWDELSGLRASDRSDPLEALSLKARSGDLVLFLGAGVSAGAGLPSWRQLLGELAEGSGMGDMEGFGDRSPTDQARLIQLHLDLDRAQLGKRIAEIMRRRDRYSLAHSMLAALPARESVTTNYDRLFELACDEVGRPVRTLPYERTREDTDRWLLKLHGDVDVPEDIVITREDYLRFGDQRQALVGIVQALLMTKHMLFVGFSLEDDNFHRIADDVRKVIHPKPSEVTEPFGTALFPKRDRVIEQLWKGDLRCVSVGNDDSNVEHRRIEILLDRLLAESSSSVGHLLVPELRGLLTPADQAIAELLLPLTKASPSLRTSPTWESIERLLASLGHRSG